MSTSTYPLVVSGLPEPAPSRWLWLVKWLLLIPHYIVLAFLWIAFAVVTVIAFFAILFTGRYSRGLFDFNVGVLRWSWRVTYYGYSALGTDRYPPFTLADVAEYPAHLEVEYPAALSRGLVLVKWWLLAIPQYIVVSIFVGSGTYLVGYVDSDDWPWVWGIGLIGPLVLIAAIALLFTGSYPRSIFDLVLGLNRWVMRVAAYVSLMTDRYPPFRLDLGGDDPAAAVLQPPPPRSPEVTVEPAPGLPEGRQEVVPARRDSSWTAGRVTALVLGSVLMVVSVGLGAGATALLVADNILRDDDGFLMTTSESFEAQTYAIVSDNLELHVGGVDDVLPSRIIGDVKLSVTAPDAQEIFVGIGRTDAVSDYLRGVAHTTVVEVEGRPGHARPKYRESPGGPPPTMPASEMLWEELASGVGNQTVTWRPRSGDWTVVVMNADGSAGVEVDAAPGATVPVLSWGEGVLIALALLGLAISLVLIILPARAAGRQARLSTDTDRTG